MTDENNLTDEQVEELRQKAINSAMNKFNWSLERCEEVLGSNHREFLQKVELIGSEDGAEVV